MTCSIRKADPGDEQRICELFIEMLQTIYHADYLTNMIISHWRSLKEISQYTG